MSVLIPRMVGLVPEGKRGEAEVFHGEDGACRLLVGGVPMMVDSAKEREDVREFLAEARGDVLVLGLGIGMVLPPLIASARVRTVTVVEKSADVAEYVGEVHRHPKLSVVRADAREWWTTGFFDSIWIDIWPIVHRGSAIEARSLREKYSALLREGGWIGVWREQDHEAAIAESSVVFSDEAVNEVLRRVDEFVREP